MDSIRSFRADTTQRGYILIVVLAILTLISLLTVATYLTTSTSLKNSVHEVDHRYALDIAERASKLAAQEIAQQFADPNGDIFPPVGSYSIEAQGIIFSQLLEKGPLLRTFDGKVWPQYFTTDCSGKGIHKGFCAPAFLSIENGATVDIPPLPPVSERKNVFNLHGSHCGNAVTIEPEQLPTQSVRPPCYVVEFLGIATDTKSITYRITVIAWGRYTGTTARLESTYIMDYD